MPISRGASRGNARRSDPSWRDFAVLYRQHKHRDELVTELAERGIPFSIEGLDVLDTPEVRDVIACLTAAVSPNDAASLFRVAALPQFGIDATELRAAMRAVRRQELDLPAVLAKLAGGGAVLQSVEKAHRLVEAERVRADDAVNAVIRHFELPRSPLVGGAREVRRGVARQSDCRDRKSGGISRLSGLFCAGERGDFASALDRRCGTAFDGACGQGAGVQARRNCARLVDLVPVLI